MEKTMQAAVVRELKKPLIIQEMPVPRPGPGEVLIRVIASGVCHTDVHAADGDWPVKPTLPFIPGHEGCGYVAAVGSGVSYLREGDRVGVPFLYSACGHCEFCVTGWETVCPEMQITGYLKNGGFADYVLAEAAYVGHIPAALEFTAAAPILCAGVTTYKALKETEAKPGDWVAISGVGGLGHLAVQYAKAMGLHVVAIDIGESKLKLARELGADVAVDATRKDTVAEVLRQTGGGAHGVVITAPSLSAFTQGIAMVRRRGTCALVGLPPGDFPMDLFDVVLKRITVRGSLVGTRQDLAEALSFAAEGKVDSDIEMGSISDINTVFDRLRTGKVRARVVLQIAAESGQLQSKGAA